MIRRAPMSLVLVLAAGPAAAQFGFGGPAVAGWAIVGKSTIAAMPAASTVDRGLWYVTDDADCNPATADDGFIVCLDIGASWLLLGPGAGGGGTPDPHAASHQNAGSDEISVAGLSGLLADAQTPLSHVHAAADTTSGAFADARVDGSLEADELLLAGDVDGAANAGDLDEAAVETELEAVLDLADQQGAVTDEQVPDTITAGNYAPLAGATFTGAVSIDNAQSLRLLEDDANGSNHVEFAAPPALTSNTTCTLENDSSPIPDSCVGDGTDGGGATSSGTGLQKGDGAGGLTDTGVASTNGGLAIVNTSAAAVPLSITGAASQSANLLDVTANGGAAGALFNIDSAGRLHTADGSTGVPMIGNKYAFNNANRAGWYWDNGNAAIIYTQGGTDYQFLATNFVRLGSSGVFQWTNAGAVAAADHGISRCSGGGGVCIGSGGAGGFDQAIKSNAQITGATNGGMQNCAYSTELLTLSTGGATTDTSASLAPATSRVEAITYRITTTITTATAFTVKVKAGNSFCSVGTATTSQTTLTSGTTGVLVPCAFADQYNTAAAKLTVDTTGTPSGGALRLHLHSCAFTAPTS